MSDPVVAAKGEPQGGFDLLLPSRRITATRALETARCAEERGWTGLWCSEVLALDALALLAAVATHTTTLRLGTAIVPTSTRSVALLGMAASTVAQLAPGRLHLGLGVSTPTIVGDRHDRPVAHPLAEAVGTLRVLRQALAGERVAHPSSPHVEDLRIEPPAAVPPLHLAAVGPRMHQAAYRHADGVVLNLLSVADARTRAAEARSAARDGFENLLLVRTCVDPSADDLQAITRELASYCRVPVYAHDLQRRGWSLEAVHAAPSLDDARDRLPEGMVDELAVVGSAEHCRTRLRAYRDAGVTPLVLPVGVADALDRVLACL